DDDDGGLLVVGGEAASGGHGELCDVEEVGACDLSPDAVGLGSVAADGCGHEVEVGGDAGEAFSLFADVEIDGLRKVVAALAAVVGARELNECCGIADVHGLQQELADDGEDGGVGCDSDADGEEYDGDEGGGTGEAAQGVGEVAPEGFGGGLPSGMP